MVVERLKSGLSGPANSTGSARQGNPLGLFFLLGYLVFTALLAGVGVMLGEQAERADRAQRELAQQRADALVGRIGDWVDRYGDLIEGWAADPQLNALFATADLERMQQRGETLARLYPGVLRVRLLLPEQEGRGSKPATDLGFAALEMLRSAAGGEGRLAAEVHQFGNQQAHVALVSRVPLAGADSPAGYIHLALPFGFLQQQLHAIEGFSGSLVLQQAPPSGEAFALSEYSGGAVAQAAPDGVLAIPGTIWRLSYWYRPPISGPLSGAVWGWAVLGGIWALAGLVFYLMYRWLRQSLRGYLLSVTDLVEWLGSDQAPPPRTVALPELVQSLRVIREKAAKLRGHLRMGEEQSEEARPDMPEAAGALGPGRSSEIQLPAEIFRSYDIRGLVGESLNAGIMFELGLAVASEVQERGERTVIVGRDGRNSSPELQEAFSNGLQAAGAAVIDLGMVPTPLLYFATHFVGSDSGAIVTGSHNPRDYNGLKVVIGGAALSGAAIQGLRERIEHGNLYTGQGSYQEQDLLPDYLARITEDVNLARPLKVVVDCGNGVAGLVAPLLLRELGCEVIELFCDVDGSFPNHHPDPSQPDNLLSLMTEVTACQADLGLAFDGDGDRLGVVDSAGNIVWPDRVLMLLALEVLSSNPGADVIFDVKCSRHLADQIRAHGGRPVMWHAGHSLLKAKVRETGAPLAGEFSGHIIFGDRWYGFDDALYAAARLLELLTMDELSSAEVFAELPESPSTPELILVVSEGEAEELMRRLLAEARFPGAQLITIDGLRAEFADGWGLVRASNTTPALGFRFEADSVERLEQIKKLFRDAVLRLRPDLRLPF